MEEKEFYDWLSENFDFQLTFFYDDEEAFIEVLNRKDDDIWRKIYLYAAQTEDDEITVRYDSTSCGNSLYTSTLIYDIYKEEIKDCLQKIFPIFHLIFE